MELEGKATIPADTASPSTVFDIEPLASCWDDARELTALHHAEVSAIEADKFNPDHNQYLALEAGGLLRVFTLRVDGKLMGYNIFVVVPNMHYKGMLWAAQDVLFVHRDHRGSRAAHFLRWTDQVLFDQGAECIHRHVTTKVDYSGLLEHEGYTLIERGYIKRP